MVASVDADLDLASHIWMCGDFLSHNGTCRSCIKDALMTRKVTNEDLKKYIPMVNKFIRDSVVKNWNEASSKKGQDDIMLGNSGMSVADIRQQLMTEVVVALQKYNPDFKTAEGRGVKESTFVYTHLGFRTGQLMKRLTKKRYGYGVWSSAIEEALGERFEEEA